MTLWMLLTIRWLSLFPFLVSWSWFWRSAVQDMQVLAQLVRWWQLCPYRCLVCRHSCCSVSFWPSQAKNGTSAQEGFKNLDKLKIRDHRMSCSRAYQFLAQTHLNNFSEYLSLPFGIICPREENISVWRTLAIHKYIFLYSSMCFLFV